MLGSAKRNKSQRSAAKRVSGWASNLGSTITGTGRRAKQQHATSVDSDDALRRSAVAVDLPSTLARFSVASFSADQCLGQHFSQSFSLPAAHELKHELEARKAQTSDELRSYVTRHYPSFISTSQEIVSLANDLSSFSALLASMSDTLQSLQANTFAYNDDKLAKKSMELEDKKLQSLDGARTAATSSEESDEELRALIYERKFEQAVTIIEQSQLQAHAHDLDDRLHQLIDTLCLELSSSAVTKAERRRLMSWLIRLDSAEIALKLLLEHRSSTIRAQTKTVKMAGDIVDYVRQLSAITVNGLLSTVSESAALFSDDSARHSVVIVWCENELALFASIVSRQSFITDIPFAVIHSVLVTVFDTVNNAKQQGLTLDFLLAQMIAPAMCQCFNTYFAHSHTALTDALTDEEWRASEYWVHELNSGKKPKKRAIKLTVSAKLLYDLIRAAFKDLLPLLDSSQRALTALIPYCYSSIVTGTIELFERYLVTMASSAQSATNRGFDDEQSLSIIANAFYLADDLLPRLGREFRRRFHRVITEIERFGGKLGKLYESLLDHYCHGRSQHWCQTILGFDQLLAAVYTQPHDIPLVDVNAPAPALSRVHSAAALGYDSSLALLGVTAGWLRLQDYFVLLRSIIGKCLTISAIPIVLTACLEELFLTVLDQPCFDTDEDTGDAESLRASGPHPSFGFGGLLQFTRDLTFFTAATRDYASARLVELKDELLDRARLSYVRTTGSSEEEASTEQDLHAQNVEQLCSAPDRMTLHHIIAHETASSSSASGSANGSRPMWRNE